MSVSVSSRRVGEQLNTQFGSDRGDTELEGGEGRQGGGAAHQKTSRSNCHRDSVLLLQTFPRNYLQVQWALFYLNQAPIIKQYTIQIDRTKNTCTIYACTLIYTCILCGCPIVTAQFFSVFAHNFMFWKKLFLFFSIPQHAACSTLQYTYKAH